MIIFPKHDLPSHTQVSRGMNAVGPLPPLWERSSGMQAFMGQAHVFLMKGSFEVGVRECWLGRGGQLHPGHTAAVTVSARPLLR